MVNTTNGKFVHSPTSCLFNNNFQLINISAACFEQCQFYTSNSLREKEEKRLDSVTTIPIITFNGRIKFHFGSKDTSSLKGIRINFRMQQLAGPHISAVKWTDIRFHIIGQWVIACFIFLKTARFRRYFMNTFLVSLGLSDIFMALLIMPGHVVFCTSSCSQFISKHCWLISSTRYLVFSATKLNLLAISYDRYIAVMHPLKYNAKINFKRVLTILTTVWTIPVILALSRLAWWIKLPKAEALILDRVFNSCLIFLLMVLPVSILTAVNLRILLEIRKHSTRLRPVSEESVTETQTNCTIENNNKRKRQAGRKGTLSCVLVVVIFVLCWLPRTHYNVARLLGKGDGPLLNRLSLLFLFVQSAVNPFIYTFYRSDFRRAAVRLLRCR